MTIIANLTMTFVAITLLLLVSIGVFAMIAEVIVCRPVFADKIIKVMVKFIYLSSYAVVLLLFVLVTLVIWS
jgi:hypothetical protein